MTTGKPVIVHPPMPSVLQGAASTNVKDIDVSRDVNNPQRSSLWARNEVVPREASRSKQAENGTQRKRKGPIYRNGCVIHTFVTTVALGTWQGKCPSLTIMRWHILIPGQSRSPTSVASYEHAN